MENLRCQIEEKRKSGDEANKKAKDSLNKAKAWVWEWWDWLKEFIWWARKQLVAALWSGTDKIREKAYKHKLKEEGISDEEKEKYIKKMKKCADRSKTRALKSRVHWETTKSWLKRNLKWWVKALWYWLKSWYHKLDKIDNERWAKKLEKQEEIRNTKRENAKTKSE